MKKSFNNLGRARYGRSLILDHFTQHSSGEHFFVKIVLNTCTKALKETNLEMSDDLIDFVLRSLLHKTNEQEISLLKHLATKEEKLIVMFDGLDEVNAYKEQVIHLIDELNKNYRIKKILITTRDHLKQELEDHFSTFAFNLNNFDEEDQKNFLVKYWRSLHLKNQERPTSVSKLELSADKLLSQVKSSLTNNISGLIGIPLQTKMLADIYFVKDQNFSTKLDEITNLAELYGRFIESKIKIQSEEKNKRDMTKENPQKLKREEKMFYSDHFKLSSSILADEIQKQDLELTDEEILEYGVVVAFASNKKNKTPTFLHQSFAEFFLAQNSFQKLIIEKSGTKSDKELKEILSDQRHFLIRKFLNDLMSKRREIDPKGEQQKEIERDFTLEIENCCRENLLSLLKHLIERSNEEILKKENNFFRIATGKGHKEIVLYLLEQGIDVNIKGFDGHTALITASDEGQTEIVQLLLNQKDINVNLQNGYRNTALMQASRWGRTEIVQMLLKHKDIEINLQDLYGDFALLMALWVNPTKEIFKLLLEHKDIEINQQNNKGQTCLLYACECGKKEIVQLLLNHKNIEINKQDKEGTSALYWACDKGHTEIVQILLQQKEIDVNIQKNSKGRTALLVALESGHFKIVEILLQDKNINVNVNEQYNWAQSALIGASRVGHKEIVQFLLLLALNKNHQQENEDNEIAALMLAIKTNYKEIVQLLLQQKDINVNLQDEVYGLSPLVWASKNGHTEIVQLLLQHKDIEINQISKNMWESALMKASKNGHKEIVQMLLKHKDIMVNHVK